MAPVWAWVLTVALVGGGVGQAGPRTCEDLPRYQYLRTYQPPREIGERLESRVTFYTLRGVTCSGDQTAYGVAACSWNVPMYSQLEFPDGFVVTCLDRGTGVRHDRGHPHWVDVWSPSHAWGLANVEADYGTVTELSVVRWGP